MTKAIDPACLFSSGAAPVATPAMLRPGQGIADLPLVPTVPRVSLCPRCRARVRVPGTPCDACRPAHIRAMREELLGEARRTIPPMFAGHMLGSPSLASFVARRASIAEARAVMDAPRIVLAGRAGRGKTTLACAIANAVLEAALDPACTAEAWRRAQGLRFIPALELATAAAQHPLGEGTAPLVRQALEAPLLILDDVGAEDHRLLGNPIPTIIYQRHARTHLQTIITTGFREGELRAKYGDGIARRLFEGAALVEVGWGQ